jgi:hypothetical protein
MGKKKTRGKQTTRTGTPRELPPRIGPKAVFKIIAVPWPPSFALPKADRRKQTA